MAAARAGSAARRPPSQPRPGLPGLPACRCCVGPGACPRSPQSPEAALEAASGPWPRPSLRLPSTPSSPSSRSFQKAVKAAAGGGSCPEQPEGAPEAGPGSRTQAARRPGGVVWSCDCPESGSPPCCFVGEGWRQRLLIGVGVEHRFAVRLESYACMQRCPGGVLPRAGNGDRSPRLPAVKHPALNHARRTAPPLCAPHTARHRRLELQHSTKRASTSWPLHIRQGGGGAVTQLRRPDGVEPHACMNVRDREPLPSTEVRSVPTTRLAASRPALREQPPSLANNRPHRSARSPPTTLAWTPERSALNSLLCWGSATAVTGEAIGKILVPFSFHSCSCTFSGDWGHEQCLPSRGWHQAPKPPTGSGLRQTRATAMPLPLHTCLPTTVLACASCRAGRAQPAQVGWGTIPDVCTVGQTTVGQV